MNAVSYSAAVKNELCRDLPAKACCMLAEAYGVILFSQSFSSISLKIVSQHAGFARRAELLIKSAFGVSFDETSSGRASTTLTMTDKEKLAQIIETLGFQSDDLLSIHLNLGLLEEDCCKASFLRGAFLAGGTVMNPQSGSHLEMRSRHRAAAREALNLITSLDYPMKLVMRSGASVLYIKRAAVIEDFLTLIGAKRASMAYIDAKIEKDLRLEASRKTNCDTANITKSVESSAKHMEIIDKLRDRLDSLPPILRETAILRMENPELSLTELGALLRPQVTKSAMHHRFKKMEEFIQT